MFIYKQPDPEQLPVAVQILILCGDRTRDTQHSSRPLNHQPQIIEEDIQEAHNGWSYPAVDIYRVKMMFILCPISKNI